MRKIVYPADLDALKRDYLSVFPADELRVMQTKWEPLRDNLRRVNGNAVKSRRLYPDRIIDVIMADYELLVDMFVDYYSLRKQNGFDENWHDELKKLFHYSGEEGCDIQAFQPAIANFFMRHQKDMKIDVCFYCELSYINSYGFSETYKEIGAFLMKANRHHVELHIRKVDGEKYKIKLYDKIMALRKQPGVTVDNIEDRFNDIFKQWLGTKKKSEEVKRKMRNHFDLDHFLPKSECPLVGLSLMNFVPCCAVCNEKLKGKDILGGEDERNWKYVLKKVSPISSNYNFDQTSKLRLLDNGHGWLRAQEHPDDYTLEFKSSDPDYQSEIIDEFHLEERYTYHKCEALRWHDLRNDYPTSRIKEMAKALKGYKTEEQLRNDIFQTDYFENNVRCFDKLRRDILGMSTEL